MKLKPHSQHWSSKTKQSGVSLIIALVFLLIITILAVANLREATLESRITGNMIESRQLLNAADAAVRDGERRAVERGVQDPKDDCANIAPHKLCLLNRVPAYALDTSNVQVYSPSDGTTLSTTANWYAQPAPGGKGTGESENPQYLEEGGLGIGIFRYEINGIASKGDAKTAVRSTVAYNSKGTVQQAE
ncbi:pilus assembly PilX family protein [Pseudomonas sp. Gutcm_11s]|uniref:pilus assembly PilX family protein n=1 Tax=Pseudomonas sp. Gutcm_11s TaxID=3026088 RepID=UPI0023629FA1|nr:PilX N-terminal domain-containing pilus assembly protein [Pseudomonas sp. Gutcm_11s]MDD0844521.1 PilX N-terminal domain-containing pilus assembly protein [Pseudomonas sp. Gutcm_11s]